MLTKGVYILSHICYVIYKGEYKMGNNVLIVNEEDIRNKIYTIRGQRVMLDSDLAEIYGYTTKAFNQQVQRNIEKFDKDFMFRLTENEAHNLRDRKSVV